MIFSWKKLTHVTASSGATTIKNVTPAAADSM
jgi:hypothetical protein